MTPKQEVQRLRWIMGHVEQLSPPSREWLRERLIADAKPVEEAVHD